MSAAPEPPVRRLGLSVAAAIVVANMIGTGIFTSTGYQAAGLHDGWTMILTWVVGGALALCGAAVYAELGTRFPKAGGEYVYLREAYHPAVGFMSGWVSLTAGFSAPIAVSALAFAGYAGKLLGFDEALAPGIASGLVLAVTGLHATDTLLGGRVQTGFTIGKVTLIACLILAGLLLGHGDWGHFSPRQGGVSNVGTSAFAVSLMYVSFAYSGWNAAGYIAGEIRDPQRTLPRALLLGTGLVMVLYVLLNVVFVYALAPETLASGANGAPIHEVGYDAAKALFGAPAGRLVTTLIALALVSSVSSMVMAGPRVYTAMAADRALPGFLSIRTGRGEPSVAVWTQGLLAVAFVLIGRNVDRLIQYIGFSLAVFTTLAVGSVFVFRVREERNAAAIPAAVAVPATYRTWGYPVTPLLYMGLSMWVAYSQFRQDWKWSAVAIVVLMVGAAVYAVTLGRDVKRGSEAASVG
jgi:basic amino acid/polyamine antiporter, APA family